MEGWAPALISRREEKTRNGVLCKKQAGGGNLPGNRRECGVCRKNSSDLAVR